jgi:UPF0755 protein
MPRSPAEALEPDRAPEPPRSTRRRGQHWLFVFLNRSITFFLLLSIAVALAFYVVRLQFDKPGPLGYPTVFVVPKGDGVYAIAKRLEQENIINDRWTFQIAARYFKVQDKIKAGEYNIKASASLRDILDTLVEGKSILFSISIPEGLTSYQIVERLRASPDLVGDIAELPAEGSMLPDTYRFARGTSREEIIRRMQGEQKKFVDSVWASRSRDIPLTTREEVVNMAAIVEKEASKADERPRVAAVYLNRLKKRMRLDADPTIIYGVSQGKGTLGRGLTRDELQDEDNAYNTYRRYGLPPTPIANPGRAAIEAVLRPAKTNEVFFVADGTGGHVFAETYAEHQKNVARWRKVERAQQEEANQSKSAAVNVDALQDVEMPLPARKPKR